jgi:3-hydroxybutyryl-CoA dehydratase
MVHELDIDVNSFRLTDVITKATRYDDFEIGDTVGSAMTITETHFVNAAGLFADFNPLHMNEEASRRSIFGKRILHGPCVVGLMMATVGDAVTGTGIGELGLQFEFRHPTHIGDTLSWEWTVTQREDRPKHDGGLVTFNGRCVNQDGTLIASASTIVLVANTSLFDG